MPTEFVGTLPGQVVSLGLMQSVFGSTLDRTTSRNFTGTAVTASATANGTSSWRNVRGSFMIDGQLYTGWSDGTFKVQSLRRHDLRCRRRRSRCSSCPA